MIVAEILATELLVITVADFTARALVDYVKYKRRQYRRNKKLRQELDQ